MGLNGCCGIIKYLVALVNILIWIVGALIVGVAVWMLTDPTFLISMAQDKQHYYISLYIFLAVGILMLVVAFFGCCGAFKESQCMLVSFFSILLVILVAEIAAGCWVYHNSDKLDSAVRSAVKYTVQNEYGDIPSRTVAFDAIQTHLECCGADGPNDWAASKYNKVDRTSLLDIGISRVNPFYNIPSSCCVANLSDAQCDVARKAGLTTSISPFINKKGCMERVVDEIKNNTKLVVAIGLGIVGIEVLALILSLLLCCAIRRNDHYKA